MPASPGASRPPNTRGQTARCSSSTRSASSSERSSEGPPSHSTRRAAWHSPRCRSTAAGSMASAITTSARPSNMRRTSAGMAGVVKKMSGPKSGRANAGRSDGMLPEPETMARMVSRTSLGDAAGAKRGVGDSHTHSVRYRGAESDENGVASDRSSRRRRLSACDRIPWARRRLWWRAGRASVRIGRHMGSDRHHGLFLRVRTDGGFGGVAFSEPSGEADRQHHEHHAEQSQG